MLINSQSSPAAAKPFVEQRPDWKLWLDNVVDGQMYNVWEGPAAKRAQQEVSKKIGDSNNASFCGCCGAIWVDKQGYRKAIARPLATPLNGETSLNLMGIYFGENRSAESLVAEAALEDAVTLEIKDGEKTHSLAWKDA